MYSFKNSSPDSFFDISLHMGNLHINLILEKGFFDLETDWTVFSHFHSCHEFHFILDGKIELVADDKTYLLEKSNVCVIPPSLNHYTNRVIKPAKKVSLLFHFSNSKANDGLENSEYQFYNAVYSQIRQVSILHDSNMYEKYLKPIHGLFHKNEIWCIHKIKALFTLLFIEVTEKIINEKMILLPNPININLPKECEETNQPKSKEIMNIENFINKNYMKSITLSDMADCLHLSEKQTNRTLRKLTNLSFRELLLKRRLERARELIINSDIPINEIADQIGYNSYNGFYTAFKNTFEVSPQSLRNPVEPYKSL